MRDYRAALGPTHPTDFAGSGARNRAVWPAITSDRPWSAEDQVGALVPDTSQSRHTTFNHAGPIPRKQFRVREV